MKSLVLGGSVIRSICEKSGAEVNIEDDGTIRISAVNQESAKIAQDMITSIIEEPEVGKVYKGKVVKIMEFGAFVNFLGKHDGLVHISELSDEHVKRVEDVVKEGQEITVKVVGVDEKGRVKLSAKRVKE